MPYFGNNPSPLLLNTVAQNGKEMTLDADADTSITADTDDQIDIKIGGADDFQFTANTFTAQSGSTIAAQALTATTITASGIVKTDDTTDATTTTDGSLQTDGGLSVVKDVVIGDDLFLKSDSAVINFGADNDVTLTHVADTGLTLNTGWTVTGTSTLNNDVTFTGANYNVTWDKSDDALEFGDNAKLTFGAGNDLQIYHTPGTGTFIDEAGDGDLFIRSNRVAIHKYTGESMIEATADGNVSVYYDDGKKFETTANGIVVGGATAETQHSSMKTVQVGARGFLTPFDSGATYLTSNIFYNTSSQWEYASAGAGNVLSLNNGSTYFYHTVTGSDGGQATLQERGVFYLNASNNDNYNLFQATRNSVSHYFMNYHSSSPYGVYIEHPNVAKNNTDNYFLSCVEQSNTRLKIFSAGTVQNATGTYGTLSDERLKSNIVDAKSQWDDIKALEFKNFTKFDNPDLKQLGLIAQDVEKISPNLIYETPPEPEEVKHNSEFGTLYEDGDTLPPAKEIGHVKEVKSNVKGLKESILYMKAVKALQEAMARIETLEAKVKALEEA